MVVVLGHERWSLRRDSKYRAMTGKILVFFWTFITKQLQVDFYKEASLFATT